MNNAIRSVILLLIATLAPMSALAGVVEISDVTITADANFSSQRVPVTKNDSDSTTAPPDQTFLTTHALVKEGLPFPNVPNSQNSGFASSAGSVGGLFGVGVNGFHFENSLPPNAYSAVGTWTQSVTNNSTDSQEVTINLSVPAPTIRLFGVGNSFPLGADPDLDAAANVDIRLTTKLTHADGSVVDTIFFDYGMRIVREPTANVLLIDPTDDAEGEVTRFEEFDGSFGFRLLPSVFTDFSFGIVAPGESLEFGYDYFATASTGFGETGVFAAIGDPFDLTTSGGSFSFQVDGSQPGPGPAPGIPAPGTLVLVALGLTSLGIMRRPAVNARLRPIAHRSEQAAFA